MRYFQNPGRVDARLSPQSRPNLLTNQTLLISPIFYVQYPELLSAPVSGLTFPANTCCFKTKIILKKTLLKNVLTKKVSVAKKSRGTGD
eukprot:SAG22_NODE_372_length_11551_cov_20.656741_11_plen_89_part_00